MTTARTYYAVPTRYTIGEEFDDLADAVAAAKATVTRFFYRGGKLLDDDRPGSWRAEGDGKAFYSRAFIDRRVVGPSTTVISLGGNVDESVERIEVFLTDREKDALMAAAACR